MNRNPLNHDTAVESDQLSGILDSQQPDQRRQQQKTEPTQRQFCQPSPCFAGRKQRHQEGRNPHHQGNFDEHLRGIITVASSPLFLCALCGEI